MSILIGIVAIRFASRFCMVSLALSASFVTFVVITIINELIFQSYAIEKLKDRWSPIGEWDQSLDERIYSPSDIASISLIRDWRLGPDVGRPAPTTKKIQIRLKNDKVGILIIEIEDYNKNYQKYFNDSYSDPDDVETGKKSFYGEGVQQDEFFKKLPIDFCQMWFYFLEMVLGGESLVFNLWMTSLNEVIPGERSDFYRGERGTKVDPRITEKEQVMMKNSRSSPMHRSKNS